MIVNTRIKHSVKGNILKLQLRGGSGHTTFRADPSAYFPILVACSTVWPCLHLLGHQNPRSSGLAYCSEQKTVTENMLIGGQ